MHYSALALAVAALTVGCQAFLVPSNVNKASISDDEFALLSLAGSNPNNRVLKTACKSCLADGKDGALIYDLVISNLDYPKFLVNGADLTPLDLRPGHLGHLGHLEIHMPPFLSVPLVPDSSTLGELAFTDLKPSEVKVMYNSYTEMSTLGDGEIVKLILEATSVDGRPIPRWNTEQIEVQIVREKGGKMVMLDAKVSPVDGGSMMFAGPMEVFGNGKKEKCGFFCEILENVTKWGKKAEEKMSKWGDKVGAKIRPCGKNTHGKVGLGEAKGLGEKKEKEDEEIITIMPIPIPDRVPSNPSTWRRPPYSRPYHRPHTDGEKEGHRHPRPWSHHHHHNPHHMSHTPSAASAVYKVFIQVLVPIAIGVVAGMLVSLMGMVVGHFAVLAYQKAVGAVRRNRCAPVVEAGDEEFAKGLLSREEYRDEEGEGEEAPPVYDAQTAQEVSVEKQ
ncbi:hypothetical protein EV426DRAFT_702946 [Tirmania nivea]|nr:hypothetical protein EV426DRAFT_702946 [Tirmania nivea]